MVDSRPVVVVTELDDPTADLVIEELDRRGVPVMRFDPADFPRDFVLAARFGDSAGMLGKLQTRTRLVALDSVRALYYRRPGGFDFSHLAGQDARFATVQARYGLGGVLASLPGCRYVNHPHAIADAEFKPAQLVAATDVGFTVPATLITNDPAEARAFAVEHDRIVYKPLFATPYKVDGEAVSIWVHEIHADDLDSTVAGTAHLFQVRCDKEADLRITVVGDQVFCVRIDTEDTDLLDWRYDYDQLSYTVVDPPSGLVRAIDAYLGHFGLAFGCFDFALTRSGEAVFLECNPNGQWAWLEASTGLPMTGAFADLLEGGHS